MPCWRIVFSTFYGCMSFYTGSVRLGHGGMSALSPFYPQLRTLVGDAGTAASCQSTKSLRDSPLRGAHSHRRCPQRRERQWRARRPVLRIEVSSTSLKTGVAYDDGCYQPVAPAHDRGHER